MWLVGLSYGLVCLAIWAGSCNRAGLDCARVMSVCGPPHFVVLFDQTDRTKQKKQHVGCACLCCGIRIIKRQSRQESRINKNQFCWLVIRLSFRKTTTHCCGCQLSTVNVFNFWMLRSWSWRANVTASTSHQETRLSDWRGLSVWLPLAIDYVAAITVDDDIIIYIYFFVIYYIEV